MHAWFIIQDELGPNTLYICDDCGGQSYHPIVKCQCQCERAIPKPTAIVWPR